MRPSALPPCPATQASKHSRQAAAVGCAQADSKGAGPGRRTRHASVGGLLRRAAARPRVQPPLAARVCAGQAPPCRRVRQHGRQPRGGVHALLEAERRRGRSCLLAAGGAAGTAGTAQGAVQVPEVQER